MLDASGDVNKPTHMRLPNTVRKLDWIRYDRRLEADDPLRYDDITYLSPEEFTARVLERSSEDADVLTVTDFSGAKLLIRTDKGPDWWTSFDDTYVVFDSYDSDVDSTLQQSKTMAYGAVGASWTMTDTFEPDLPEHLFPILKAETLARAALRHNQMPDATAERDSRRLRIGHIKRGARAAMPPHPYPDYGRK